MPVDNLLEVYYESSDFIVLWVSVVERILGNHLSECLGQYCSGKGQRSMVTICGFTRGGFERGKVAPEQAEYLKSQGLSGFVVVE